MDLYRKNGTDNYVYVQNGVVVGTWGEQVSPANLEAYTLQAPVSGGPSLPPRSPSEKLAIYSEAIAAGYTLSQATAISGYTP